MIKKIIFIFFVFIVSCKTIDSVMLIKDTGLADVPFAMMYDNFPFDTDTKGQLDSIKIKGKERIKLYDIIKKLKKQKGMIKNINFFPDYAFILKYNNIKDTLFFSNNFKHGYFVQNDTMLIDTTRILKKYLYKKHKSFFDKDYYYYEQKYYPREPYIENID